MFEALSAVLRNITKTRHEIVMPAAAGLLCLAAASLPTNSAGAQTALRNAPVGARVSFLNDVEPILTRSGCNQGACHGSQFGKGGLKLSLAGYDPDLDYEAVVKAGRGRRVACAAPEQSLLLQKPAMLLPHKGGLMLERGSPDYRTLIHWIQQGAAGPDPLDPHVVALRVTPTSSRYQPAETRLLRVMAQYSDGTVRNVTAHTRIASLDDTIATVTPDGIVTARGRGATAIMLRYDGLAAAARVVIPYSKQSFAPVSLETPASFIDSLVEKRWRDLGLRPSGLCSDAEFIRRASFDIVGTAPAPDEVRAFEKQRDRDKDVRLIDRLLARPEYGEYWAVKWGDLLRCNRAVLGDKAMWSFTNWIRDSLRRNRPYDAFARDLITAQGSAFTQGQANYYRVARTPQELTETTAQVFLGVRLQCARCHHHPFEKWSQNDYYHFSAFFARVGVKESKETPVGNTEPIVRLLPAGEVTHPKTGLTMAPAPLALDNGPHTVQVAATPDGGQDRRRDLAEWLTDRSNPLFPRMAVNRYWSYFFKRGIVDPVDDMRVTNPPSNPELLDALAQDFVASGYDLKHLIRTLCTSRAYRLSSRPTPQNRADTVFYSHFVPRRQSAEVLLDAISFATGSPEKFAGLPLGTRAIELPDAGVASAFLDTFGRPPRTSACECERAAEPSLTQALQLLNGDLINRKINQPAGQIARMLASGKSDSSLIDELYYLTLSRAPRAREMQTGLQAFAAVPTRRQALEDLLWALLNTGEFSSIR